MSIRTAAARLGQPRALFTLASGPGTVSRPHKVKWLKLPVAPIKRSWKRPGSESGRQLLPHPKPTVSLCSPSPSLVAPVHRPLCPPRLLRSLASLSGPLPSPLSPSRIPQTLAAQLPPPPAGRDRETTPAVLQEEHAKPSGRPGPGRMYRRPLPRTTKPENREACPDSPSASRRTAGVKKRSTGAGRLTRMSQGRRCSSAGAAARREPGRR